MSEKQIVISMIVCGFLMGVTVGIGIGNWATRRLLQMDQQAMRSEDGFCSLDGKNWWKVRADGACYSVDEPR